MCIRQPSIPAPTPVQLPPAVRPLEPVEAPTVRAAPPPSKRATYLGKPEPLSSSNVSPTGGTTPSAAVSASSLRIPLRKVAKGTGLNIGA